MIKKHNLLPGLTLILIAIVMMGSAMGFIPDIPWFKLLGGIVFVAGAVKSLSKLDFFGTFFCASIVAWIFEEELRIEHLTPFPLVVAAILLGVGLNMILGKKQKLVTVAYTDKNGVTASIDEMRKEFLSNVTHELKTPIALIQGYAEGLKEDIMEDAESRAFYCDVIIDESMKMNKMVKKLLKVFVILI